MNWGVFILLGFWCRGVWFVDDWGMFRLLGFIKEASRANELIY